MLDTDRHEYLHAVGMAIALQSKDIGYGSASVSIDVKSDGSGECALMFDALPVEHARFVMATSAAAPAVLGPVDQFKQALGKPTSVMINTLTMIGGLSDVDVKHIYAGNVETNEFRRLLVAVKIFVDGLNPGQLTRVARLLVHDDMQAIDVIPLPVLAPVPKVLSALRRSVPAYETFRTKGIL
jgi:hypothetical protein